MRKIYTKMIEKAADDGIDSWAFWGMTPRQIKCEINAFNSRIRQKMEYADTMSWMIGNYVGQAQHNPKKYPKKPNMVDRKIRISDEQMEPETMKTMLEAYAEIHNEDVINK